MGYDEPRGGVGAVDPRVGRDTAWECPLPGSRFAPDGALLERPATSDLIAPA